MLYRFFNKIIVTLAILSIAGCQSIHNWQPGNGPTKRQISKNASDQNYGLTIIEIDNNITNRLKQLNIPSRFSDYFISSKSMNNIIHSGDVIDVSIWESPPALLFGTSSSDMSGFSGSKEVKLPEQMVDTNGQIAIPFVGKLSVAGKTPQQVQDMIIRALDKKANKPSAIVRIIKNNTADVTVIGEVNNSLRMPLTGKSERILDAIAAAGGAKQSAERVSVQLTRADRTVEMLLSDIINDSRQNIRLQQGDVVSVKYRTNSYMVLGATAKNDEIDFEAKGISLMQALARAGGLNDNRADAQGVFIFRYENPYMLNEEELANVPVEFREMGRIPVVYRLNLKEPMNYIIAQQFDIKDKDIIYVSNAPAVEFNKFLGMISQSVYSIVNIRDITD